MHIVEMPSLLQTRASQGIAKDFTGSHEVISDRYALDTFLDMVRNDPIIATCMDITVEAVTANGYYFYPKKAEDKSALAQAEEAKHYFDDVLNFDMEQDNIVSTLFLYGDAPVEMVPKGGKVVEIHTLEMTEMGLKFDEHGEIEAFVQNAATAKEQSWTPDEIMYIQSRRIGSKVESYYPLESVAINYSNLLYANNYLLSIFKNLPPKLMYVLKNADRATRKDFILNLRLAKIDPGVDLVANGEADIKSGFFDFKSGLLDVIKYLRGQVLMITRVPPIWLGVIDADGANRGNSEAQITAFENRVRKIQQRISSSSNRDLLPKCKFDKVYMKYNPPSLKMEKELLENAERLRNMGANPVAISQYLNTRGIFVNPEQITEQVTKDKDLMPSRKREDKSTDKMTSNLNSQGTSDDGARKMDIRKYWYIEGE